MTRKLRSHQGMLGIYNAALAHNVVPKTLLDQPVISSPDPFGEYFPHDGEQLRQSQLKRFYLELIASISFSSAF